MKSFSDSSRIDSSAAMNSSNSSAVNGVGAAVLSAVSDILAGRKNLGGKAGGNSNCGG